MKVKSIVEKTKEFERLGSMVENMEEAIKALKNPEKDEDNDNRMIWPMITLTMYDTSVKLNKDVVESVNADLLVTLEGKVAEIKKEQEALEV